MQYYYGDNIDIKRAQPGENIPTYPGQPLKFGSALEGGRTIQKQLNRIARNYPMIPVIPETDGIYGKQTENAVKAFQQIFNLNPDGILRRDSDR